MAQYINKDALVAELEKRLKANGAFDEVGDEAWAEDKGMCEAYRSILSFIDTLEVKEVDLDYIRDELDEVVKIYKPDGDFGWGTLYNVATHFFELGLKASNPLTWEDMMTIHKCCKDAMNCNLYAWETAEGQQKIYEDVLKRFKAQKEK